MAELGTVVVKTRISDEARREFEDMLKLVRAGILPGTPSKPLPALVKTRPTTRRTTSRSTIPPEKQDTKYLRDTYPEDPVIQGYADLIERYHALWHLIKIFETIGISIEGAGIRGWNVNTSHEVREAVVQTINIDLVNKEATSRALKR